jgi:alanine racemase
VLRPERAVPSDAIRPTRAEVNLANVRHNLRLLQRIAGNARLFCVLKADGYGHGSKALARTLERAGAAGIAVALLEEAVELREAGIKVPILVMGGYYGRAHHEVLRYRLTPVVHDQGQVEALAAEVRYSQSSPVKVHLKVDTGMARLGVKPEGVIALGNSFRKHPEVELEGLMTHLACADASNQEAMAAQLDEFDVASEVLRSLGFTPSVRHAANSAALIQLPRAHMDLVRPGIALFGVEPFVGALEGLRPVMQVKSQLVSVRDLERGQSVGYGWTWTAKRASRIATLPMGYADGLSRGLSNRGSVLVRGQRAPIVGVVSMDMTMVDVTDVAGAQTGDECVVLGTQRGPRGDETISAEEIARCLDTIPWEVLTNISRRVPRFYREP